MLPRRLADKSLRRRMFVTEAAEGGFITKAAVGGSVAKVFGEFVAEVAEGLLPRRLADLLLRLSAVCRLIAKACLAGLSERFKKECLFFIS